MAKAQSSTLAERVRARVSAERVAASLERAAQGKRRGVAGRETKGSTTYDRRSLMSTFRAEPAKSR